jgi:putative spermidine/putrescine transport system substrate-binding protein
MLRLPSYGRKACLLAAALAALGASAPAARAADEVVLACYAGDIQDYFVKQILPNFEKQYNAKVTYLPGVSLATISKLQAQKDHPQIDVACLDDGPQYQAKAMGLLQPTDPAALPNLADVYKVAKMPDNIGVGWALFGVGIAYSPDALAKAGIKAPESWNDLADPRLKDHVVVDSITTTYGLDLLIMLAEANGGGVKNMDPGFAKMKEVAANVVNFDTTADLSKYFQQGEAWVGVWTNSETNAFASRTKFPLSFVYPREGAPALMATASVAKGAPHPKLAEALLNYLIGEAAQTIIGRDIGFGPVNELVKLSPEAAAKVTYGPEAAGRLVQMDWGTINTARPGWTERWNREIEQ